MTRERRGTPPDWLVQTAHDNASNPDARSSASEQAAVRDRARRVQRARLAAHVLHSRVSDPVAHTLAARTAFLDRFEREVDPDGVLPLAERARRAEHAKKAYFTRLALASSKSRGNKKARRSK
jgi:hypothetical protein